MELNLAWFIGFAPVKKPDPDDPSKKILDYVEPAGKSLLSNAGKFLEMLQEFDKDNIPDKVRFFVEFGAVRTDIATAPPQVIKKVGPYIENPDFTPKAIEKASVACKAICMWSDAASSVTLNLTSGRWRRHDHPSGYTSRAREPRQFRDCICATQGARDAYLSFRGAGRRAEEGQRRRHRHRHKGAEHADRVPLAARCAVVVV